MTLVQGGLSPREVLRLFQDPDCYLVQPRRFRLGALDAGSSIVDITVTATGSQAAGETGSVTVSAAAGIAATGSEATTQTGTVTISASATVTITGSQAAGETGTVTVTNATIVSISGTEAASETGNVTVTASASWTLTGSECLVEIGSVTIDNGIAPQEPSWLRLPLSGEIDATHFEAEIDAQELTAILG